MRIYNGGSTHGGDGSPPCVLGGRAEAITSVCIYMYVCAYVYIYTGIHTPLSMHTYVHTCMFMSTHMSEDDVPYYWPLAGGFQDV